MTQRDTIQRALVLETVNKLNRHATADEIYEAIVLEHPSVGRGTVYRNLNRLAESGEIRKIEIPNGANHFEHKSRDHYHVRCEQCGRVFDVDMEYVKDLEKNIRDAHGFAYTGHDIVFRGICAECQAAIPTAHTGAKKHP